MEKFSKLMENTFKLREMNNGKTEIIAGVTTFMDDGVHSCRQPEHPFLHRHGPRRCLYRNGSGSLPWHPAHGTFRQLSIALAQEWASTPISPTPLFSATDIAGRQPWTAVFAEGIIFIVLSLTNVVRRSSTPFGQPEICSQRRHRSVHRIHRTSECKIVLSNSSTVARPLFPVFLQCQPAVCSHIKRNRVCGRNV